MQMLKAIILAFSMYSKIPMPQYEWKEEDMKYILCFFPWVGAVIGVLVYSWSRIYERYEINTLCYVMIGTVIPLVITGGFHVDGFMDTMDAFHSYGSREQKLKILKDSHIGAFAVIMLGMYGLIYMAAFSEIQDRKSMLPVCAGFYLARCLSGISVVSFPSAKEEGMLRLFACNARKSVVKGALYIQLLLCIGFMLWYSVYEGMIIVLVAMGTFAYYYYRSKKELGGITGDTAGYFVLICECSMLVAAAVLETV